MKIDLKKFEQYHSDKLINKQKHPSYPIIIWNYTQIAQYSKAWDEVTLNSRGLVTDLEGNILARPLPKFFNIEEVEYKIPDLPFRVYEKLDGSLGILFYYNDEWIVATRGSFSSDQAVFANQNIQKYIDLMDLKPDYTYLFEIIYPQNRIVVDYKGETKFPLLAVIDTESGQELDIADVEGFNSKALAYPCEKLSDLFKLKSIHTYQGDEGFVVKFENNYRVKVKHDEYVKLHRVMTGLSSRHIWEAMSSGLSLESYLENVPDEFYDWVKATEKELREAYEGLLKEAKVINHKYSHLDKKELAFKMQEENLPSVIRATIFAMRDEKSYVHIIWKSIRPEFELAFSSDTEG